MTSKYTIRKYDGDDLYSWAVFKKEDLKGQPRGVVFYGQTKRPIVCGLSRQQAAYYKAEFDRRDAKLKEQELENE